MAVTNDHVLIFTPVLDEPHHRLVWEHAERLQPAALKDAMFMKGGKDGFPKCEDFVKYYEGRWVK